jgi:protein-disulfide isomerase
MSLSIAVGKDDHVHGPSDAPLTLVEYGDYQCPHCARAHPVIKAIQQRLGTQLRFVFRNMPLNQAHPFAELAAEAAEAAAAQGKFWEMHDGIYEHQESLGPELLLQLAQQLKLDIKQFEDDLKSRKYQAHVKSDTTIAGMSKR